jgi:hypothetical protein
MSSGASTSIFGGKKAVVKEENESASETLTVRVREALFMTYIQVSLCIIGIMLMLTMQEGGQRGRVLLSFLLLVIGVLTSLPS